MSAEWTELFAVFEQSLNEWLARAEESASAPSPHPTEPVVLHQFEERLKRLQAYLDKAEHDAEQALAPLTSDIEALEQCLDTLKHIAPGLPGVLLTPGKPGAKDPADR